MKQYIEITRKVYDVKCIVGIIILQLGCLLPSIGLLFIITNEPTYYPHILIPAYIICTCITLLLFFLYAFCIDDKTDRYMVKP